MFHINPRGSQMPTDQATSSKATLTRFQAAMSSGDWELISKTIDEVVEPDALIRTPLPIEATGAELLKEVFARLHRAFPDLHITIEDLIAEGDKAVARNTVTGTHQGEYMGLPPTGKSITYNEISHEGAFEKRSHNPAAARGKACRGFGEPLVSRTTVEETRRSEGMGDAEDTWGRPDRFSAEKRIRAGPALAAATTLLLLAAGGAASAGGGTVSPARRADAVLKEIGAFDEPTYLT